MGGYVFPEGLIFQQYRHDRQMKNPVLDEIKGVTEYEHGTYKIQPYYTFVRSKTTGKIYLISDTGLRAELTFIEDIPRSKYPKQKNRGAIFKIAFENVAKPVNYPNAILIYNPPECDDEAHPSFLVRGTDLGFEYLPQGEHPFGQYSLSLPRLGNDKGNTVEWGSPFAPKQAGFNLLLLSWDLTKIDFTHIARFGRAGQVLEPPNGQTFNYDQPGGHIVVPYGWSFVWEPEKKEADSMDMVTSGVDLMNSIQKSAGFHISGGVEASMPGIFEASADFSVTGSTELGTKIQDMYEGQKIFGTKESIELSCAFVLDKRNAQLSEDFKQAVNALRLEMNKHPDGVLPEEFIKGSERTVGFIQVWGTHYLYAATFGQRSVTTTTYTKEHVSKLISENVDVKNAWTAGVKVKVLAVGGHLEGGQNTEEAKEAERKFNEITEHQVGVTITVGGPQGETPIYVDLRPLSDLLGPPFYTDEATAITLRDQIAAAIPPYAFTRLPLEKLRIDGSESAISFYKIEFSVCNVRVTSIRSEGQTFSDDPDPWLEIHSAGGSYVIAFPLGSLVAASGPFAGSMFVTPLLGAWAVVYTLKDSIPVHFIMPSLVVGHAPAHSTENIMFAGNVKRSTGQSVEVNQSLGFQLQFDIPLNKLGESEIKGLSASFTVDEVKTNLSVKDPKYPGTWPKQVPVTMGPLSCQLEMTPFFVTVSKVNLKSTFGLTGF